METSQVKPYLKMNSKLGLTLIEVLIALAIVGIAMMAIIKATAQNIRSTGYLQNKTIAMWVGQQVLNEARVGLLKVPNPPDKLKQTTKMLGQEWLWTADQESTPNNRVKQVVVKVFAQTTEDEEDLTPIITLESFVYHEE